MSFTGPICGLFARELAEMMMVEQCFDPLCHGWISCCPVTGHP